MIKALKRAPQVGIVGPMTDYAAGPQKVHDLSGEETENLEDFASRCSEQHCGQTISTPRVIGLCMLVLKEVVDRIGGMDETFGIGNFEEDDFSLRALRLGYKALIAKDVFIHHAGGQTVKGAQLDYHKCMLDAWKIFSEKWRLSKDFPEERIYSVDLQVLEPSRIYNSISDIHSTHIPDESGRWWMETPLQKREGS